MKKLIILLVLLAPFFSGCSDIETRLTLDNKSAQVVSSLTYKGDLSNKSNKYSHIIDNKYSEFLNSEYNISTSYGSKFSTISGTKKIEDIFKEDVDLSSLGFKSNLPSGKYVEIKKNFFVTSYNINAVFDYPSVASKFKEEEKKADEKPKNIAMQPEYLQKYGESDDLLSEDLGKADFEANLDESVRELANYDIKNKPIASPKDELVDETVNMSFSIELPSFAYYNNADLTDGYIYTWNIKKDEPTEIKLQYVRYSGFAVFSIIVIGILLLMYLAYRITRHENQKRVGSNN